METLRLKWDQFLTEPWEPGVLLAEVRCAQGGVCVCAPHLNPWSLFSRDCTAHTQTLSDDQGAWADPRCVLVLVNCGGESVRQTPPS